MCWHVTHALSGIYSSDSSLVGIGVLGGPDIQRDIVPDENLTPEQLMKREAGLDSLRKIHQMLLADEASGDNQGRQTDFSHINMAMAQDRQMGGPDEFGYRQMGPGMGPGGPPMSMGGPMGPGGPIGPMPSHPGMGHPGHPHMGPGGPMPPQGYMGPGGPMPPHMAGPHMEPGAPPTMGHQKPPPPYGAPPMGAPEPAPPTRKSKKRKGSTQSPAPVSPMGPSMKSPKYQVNDMNSFVTSNT